MNHCCGTCRRTLPFAGSGSTLCAAVLEGFNPLGFDLSAEYAAIANARIEYWRKHPEGPAYEPDEPQDCEGRLDLFGAADGRP